MPLTLSRRRIVLSLVAIGVAGAAAMAIGGSRVAIVVACVAALALIDLSIRLLGVVTEQSVPRPDRDDAPGTDAPCPVCDYSLRGLPDSGICPECGGAYDLDGSDVSATPHETE